MDRKLRILMVEDNPADADLNAEGLSEAGVSFEHRRVETREDFAKALDEYKPDVILADYRLPRFDGITALRLAHERYPFIPFIIVSGVLEEETAVELFREGASDYLRKGNLARLGPAVKKALELRDAREAKARVEEELRRSYGKLERRVEERTRQLARANETLRLERELLQTIIDSIPVMLTMYDTAMRHVRINKFFAQVTGWTQEDAQRDLMARIYPDPGEREEAARFMRSLSPGWRDLSITAKDGSKIATSWANVRLPDGRQVGIGLDIRERRKAEEALRRREEEFRTLAENAPVGIMRLDAQGTYLYVNREAEGIMQNTRDRIVGRHVGEFGMPGDAQAVFRKDILQTLEHRQATGMELAFPRKERTYHYQVRFVPEPSAGGAGTVLAIFSDITDLKETEARLKQAGETAELRANEAEEGRRILDAIMEYIPEGLLVADGETKTIQTASRFVAEYAGRSREQLRGMTLGEYRERLQIANTSGENLRPEEIPVYRSLTTGQIVIDEEYLLKRKNGETVNVLINTVPIRDARGAITGAVASWRDITERKRAEDTLRRNEYELRTLVENSPDLIFRVNRRLEYVYANSAYERLTGIPRDRMTGRTNEQLGMSRRLAEFWRTSLLDVVENGRERSVEFEIDSFFGKRYFSARLVPEFDKSGLVETVLVIARDITERRRAEERIRFISFHDEVTGLFNRAFFEEEIRRVDTERNLPVGIIMGDVNNLKLTNDVFGHEEGDRLLRAIADSIRRACRQSDIVARWGGDEFAVILPQTDPVTAESICDRISEITRGHKGTVLQPSIAVGIAAKEHRDQNIYQVIRRAEQNMYEYKLDHARENQDLMLSMLLDYVRERMPDHDLHIARSLKLARRFGDALALSDEQRRDLKLLVELHDIGMAVVPAGIPAKPGRLTAGEWEVMKKRVEAGFRIVKTYADTARISDEVLSQAEHWDGTGYPRKLKGADIPFLARVFMLIDAFDAMTRHRPYAPALTGEEAVEELRRNAGGQFDPGLADIFIGLIEKQPAAART